MTGKKASPNSIVESNQNRAQSAGGLADKADHIGARVFRSAIAAVPFVGGSISVMVESHLSSLQRKRIDELFSRLSELDSQVEKMSETPAFEGFSESLLEYAAMSVIRAEDEHRASVVANILHHLRDDDPHEIVRRFLIELATHLTRYELALLLNYSGARRDDQSSAFRQLLMNIHSTASEIDEVRAFSQSRLTFYGLLDVSKNPPSVTAMGEKLLSVL